jgi:large subunit ribosomal protein L10
VKRSDKTAEIDYLQGQFQAARHAFLVGFSGLSVGQVSDLRRKVRETGSSYRVVKNRLALRAAKDTPLDLLSGEFRTSTAVAYNDNDPVALAKVLSDFAKDHPALVVRAGVIEGKEVLDGAAVESLAKLPGLPELRAQLLALVQTPATQLVRLLGTPATQVARALDERGKKLSEESGS